MSITKEDLFSVLGESLQPVLNVLQSIESVILITGKGKENYVPQVQEDKISNKVALEGKVFCILRRYNIFHKDIICKEIIKVIDSFNTDSIFSTVSLDKEPLIDRLTEICMYCIDMEGDTGLQTSPIYMRDNIKRAVDKWDSRVSTVPTIPDADHYMQEIRRYLQHYDNKEMSAASLINVFAKEINRYFE